MEVSNSDIPLASIDGPQPGRFAADEQSRPAKRTIAVSILMLVGGFVVTANVVHLFIRDPLHLYAAIRSEKLALLDDWRGRATSAAFGSSHVDNGFDPRVFDLSLRDTGEATTSINLGISGGCQTEQAAVLSAFLNSLSGPTLNSPPRFLLLEITASANFTKDHLFHPRAINIYDFQTILLALDFADRTRVGLRRALGRSTFALIAGLLHYANVGMLGSEIFSPPLNPELVLDETKNDRRGLTPNQLAPPESRDFLAVQETLAQDRIPLPRPGEILEGHFAMLRSLASEARNKKVRFVYFVAPRLDNLDTYPVYPDWIPGPLGPVPILNEGRPALHPELYRAEMWHDPSHLTEAGAALFSRLLAEDLKAKLHLAANAADGTAIAFR